MSPQIYTSHKRHAMNERRIVSWILDAYWGQWMTETQVKESLKNSMLFGAFIAPNADQIGFARVVSDHHTFAAVTDVYVAAEWRGQGVGRKLMQAVVAHPSVRRSICILRTRDENAAFYAKFGFTPVPGGIMQLDPQK